MPITKPDFLIIGAPKAATTSLWAILREQSGIYMPAEKEPRFFSHDENYQKDWNWYQSLFDAAPTEAITGEASPHYSMTRIFPNTVERIASHLPDVKIIYSVRNPFTALASAWRQYLSSGDSMPQRHTMPSTFESALRNWPPLPNTVAYWTCLKEYRRHFSDSQIQIVYYEDFTHHPLEVIQQCLTFLGLDSPPRLPEHSAKMNPGTGKSAYAPIVWRMRGLPGWSNTMRLFPRSWKTPFKDKLRRSIDLAQIWTDDAIESVNCLLYDEGFPLLEYTGRSHTYWEPPPHVKVVSRERSSEGHCT